MVKAVKDASFNVKDYETVADMVLPGVLIQCDASIKAIINKIDSQYHEFILEDLDDEAVIIKESKLAELKIKLKEALKDTVREAEESGSD
ncbi:hypothetical protein NA57DRAFT_78166 [Rhizodiscina lignyota]|uniref:General transcription and DNA repair factor IIH subunit TFB5 n=1 Tax=Rhizodiscina lignyota TaxID=1504668 RepID=A0A9P4I7D8_9PEZI|nr:hypothetical protein NA57DRAFT_78166 [Rhizodiscina lignyota]